jgi:hypothetical protein
MKDWLIENSVIFVAIVGVVCIVAATAIYYSRISAWEDNCTYNLQGRITQTNQGKGALCLSSDGRILDSR